MPSTNKTSKGLSQFVGEDRLKREDYNTDMQVIDDELVKLENEKVDKTDVSQTGGTSKIGKADSNGFITTELTTYQSYNYNAIYGKNYINSGTGGQNITMPLAVENKVVEFYNKTLGAVTFLTMSGSDVIYDLQGNDITSNFTASYSLSKYVYLKFIGMKSPTRVNSLEDDIIKWHLVAAISNDSTLSNSTIYKTLTEHAVKEYVDTNKIDKTQILTDQSFESESDTEVASQKAIKYYVINYVTEKISELINNSPDALDTLNELAVALGNDPDFATTVTNALTSINTELSTLDSEKISETDVSQTGEVNKIGKADSNGFITTDLTTYQSYNYTAIYGKNYINSGTGGQNITMPLAVENKVVEFYNKTLGAVTFLTMSGSDVIYDLQGNDITSNFTASYSLSKYVYLKFIGMKSPTRVNSLEDDIIKWHLVDKVLINGLDRKVQPGTIFWLASISPPSGYLECNGAYISKTSYADLYTIVGDTFGSTTSDFKLPDLRGEFIRGWDNSRGIDTERAFGSSQTDAFQGHKHNWDSTFTGQADGTSGSRFTVGDLSTSGPSNPIGSPITDAINGTPRIASETRPRNIALMPIIKY